MPWFMLISTRAFNIGSKKIEPRHENGHEEISQLMISFLVYHFCLRSLVPLERCETEQIETNFGGLWRRRLRGLHGLDWCHPNILWHCVDRHRELLPLDIRNSILGRQRFSRELASNAGHQLHFQASKQLNQ